MKTTKVIIKIYHNIKNKYNKKIILIRQDQSSNFNINLFKMKFTYLIKEIIIFLKQNSKR